ncbi:hypothetical protein [Streptomyces olivaceus]|uniref:hypothetical protein n=1 Tax=Streptomyces olivaceus TaxID=47716 RepID=UPI00405604FF
MTSAQRLLRGGVCGAIHCLRRRARRPYSRSGAGGAESPGPVDLAAMARVDAALRAVQDL